MNFLVRCKKQHVIGFSVLVALFSLTIMIISGIAVSVLFPTQSYYTLLLAQEVFALLFILWLARASGTLGGALRKGASWGHSLLVGGYPLFLISLVAVTMASIGAESGNDLQPVLMIIIYFLSMLSIGLVEEFAFRGIIAQALIEHYGTSRAGVWRATIIGGAIFGVAHISNIFSASPLGVLVQAAVATVLGMLFAAIYYRTGNLWICVLLHAGLDAGSLLESGLYGTGTIDEYVSSFELINLMPCLTYGLPILFILRRSKLAEVAFWFGKQSDEETNTAE